MAQPEVIATKTVMRDGKEYTVRVYASQSRAINPSMRGIRSNHGQSVIQAMYAELDQLRLAIQNADKRA
jgi:hypothetical protein